MLNTYFTSSSIKLLTLSLTSLILLASSLSAQALCPVPAKNIRQVGSPAQSDKPWGWPNGTTPPAGFVAQLQYLSTSQNQNPATGTFTNVYASDPFPACAKAAALGNSYRPTTGYFPTGVYDHRFSTAYFSCQMDTNYDCRGCWHYLNAFPQYKCQTGYNYVSSILINNVVTYNYCQKGANPVMKPPNGVCNQYPNPAGGLTFINDPLDPDCNSDCKTPTTPAKEKGAPKNCAGA